MLIVQTYRTTPPTADAGREIKCKQMKGKESKRAFIRFHLLFGIGTFQRVTEDSNKKILFPVTLCLERHTSPQPRHHRRREDAAAIGKSLAHPSDFRNTLSRPFPHPT
jgi:hypothetical protein